MSQIDGGTGDTCDQDVGLLLCACSQKLHRVWVVHLPQDLNLRSEVPQSNGTAPLQYLCCYKGPMKHCFVHDTKLSLTCTVMRLAQPSTT